MAVHPRKVFYYLTTTSRQEIPTDSSDILTPPMISCITSGGKGGKRIISPSLSNASVDDDVEAAEERKREALSPSPEVDLSIPELDAVTQTIGEYHTPPTPAGSSLSVRSSLTRDGSTGSTSEEMSLAHNHRAQSPPLEGDEKEFTQTASSMRMRGMSFDEQNIRPSTEVENNSAEDVGEMQIDETDEDRASRNHEDGAALFGGQHEQQEVALGMMSSPFMKAMQTRFSTPGHSKGSPGDVEMKEPISILGDQGMGWEMREPESIDLEELDDLFGGY